MGANWATTGTRQELPFDTPIHRNGGNEGAILAGELGGPWARGRIATGDTGGGPRLARGKLWLRPFSKCRGWCFFPLTYVFMFRHEPGFCFKWGMALFAASLDGRANSVISASICPKCFPVHFAGRTGAGAFRDEMSAGPDVSAPSAVHHSPRNLDSRRTSVGTTFEAKLGHRRRQSVPAGPVACLDWFWVPPRAAGLPGPRKPRGPNAGVGADRAGGQDFCRDEGKDAPCRNPGKNPCSSPCVQPNGAWRLGTPVHPPRFRCVFLFSAGHLGAARGQDTLPTPPAVRGDGGLPFMLLAWGGFFSHDGRKCPSTVHPHGLKRVGDLQAAAQ